MVFVMLYMNMQEDLSVCDSSALLALWQYIGGWEFLFACSTQKSSRGQWQVGEYWKEYRNGSGNYFNLWCDIWISHEGGFGDATSACVILRSF